MQSYDLIDEQQIRDAAELPPVSKRLRRHVLREARKSESRRRIRRRVLLAASFLLPLVVLTGWFHGAVNSNSSDLAAEGTHRANGTAIDPPPTTDAWDNVDESLRKRRSQSNTIRGGLY